MLKLNGLTRSHRPGDISTAIAYRPAGRPAKFRLPDHPAKVVSATVLGSRDCFPRSSRGPSLAKLAATLALTNLWIHSG